jgi:hypothetical protein
LGLLAGLLSTAAVTAPAALAYQGCNTSASASASPTAANAGQPVDFTATFRDCNGQAVNTVVTFSQQSGPAGCTATFTPTSVKTDANGAAQTTVTLPAGCPCEYVLAATGNGVTVTTTVRENGCLPFTGAARPLRVPGGQVPLGALGLVLAGLLAVVGSGVFLVRSQAR